VNIPTQAKTGLEWATRHEMLDSFCVYCLAWTTHSPIAKVIAIFNNISQEAAVS
jgi:hypothetical protein